MPANIANPLGALASPSQIFSPTGLAALVTWKLANQVTPIILTNGIATSLGGALPIVALTDGGINAVTSLLSGNANPALDGFFANYKPLPGASLVSNQIASYPFANQSIAANAIISQPLNISMVMFNPAGGQTGGYPLKLVTMMALQAALNLHNITGGTYTVITPSYIYTNCVMLDMRCIDGGDDKQVQYAWQLDFIQPLVTIQGAQTALNGLMQKLTDGTPFTGTPSWSVFGMQVGNPTSLITNSLVPSPAGAASGPPLTGLQ